MSEKQLRQIDDQHPHCYVMDGKLALPYQYFAGRVGSKFLTTLRDKKQIQLVVQLDEWDANKEYDRIGTADTTIELLGVHIPYLQIPVKSGRNIPIIIETAAMNQRLKKMGYYSAKEFNQNILKWLESENARNLYFKKKSVF